MRSILCEDFKRTEGPTADTCKRNIASIKKNLAQNGIKTWKDVPVIADIDGMVPNFLVDRSPCLTAKRGPKGFWLLDQQRRMTPQERARVMGMEFSRVAPALRIMSENQFGEVLGNSITLEPMGSILKHLLEIARLV
eukprot:3705033-Pyramimonas_sp.AAC.1